MSIDLSNKHDKPPCRRGTLRVGLILMFLPIGFGSPERQGFADDSVGENLQPRAVHRQGHDWPQFLGPDDTGVSRETKIETNWPKAGPPVLWKARVGTGYSAPSVRGNRLVLHHRLQDEDILTCYEASSGRKLWETRARTTYEDPYGYNNGPRATPILTQEFVISCGADGRLQCSRLESGEVVWTRELKREFKLPDWFFGFGTTPILYQDRVIVQVGGQPNAGVVAFDLNTGKTKWARAGQETWDNVRTGNGDDTYQWTGEEQVTSYSSPVMATFRGKPHLLCLLRHGLVSLNPSDGSENFHYWFRARVHESVNAARPVVIGDSILLSAAYKMGSVLLQVKPSGKSVEEVWRDRRNLLAHWSTPIANKDYVWGFSGRHEHEGELRCIRLSDGELMWKTTGYEGLLEDLPPLVLNRRTGHIINQKTSEKVLPPFFGRGSLIQVGEHFLALGEYGTLSLIKVRSDQFEELHRTFYPEIHFPAWTAPVLSRGRLFLRCEDGMICLDLQPNSKVDQ